MTNVTGAGDQGGPAGEALLESMQAVQYALIRTPGLSSEQLLIRLQEWQQMVQELIGGQTRGEELAALHEMVSALNSSLDLTKTLGLVMDALIHLTGAERGCLMMSNQEGRLEVRAAQSFDQGSVDAHDLELSRTVVQDAVGRGCPVLTTNAQRDPRFSDLESVVGYHLRSIVCVPLQIRDEVIGALYLDNRMRDGVFSEKDLPLLTAFAQQAAVAIDNARMYTMTDQALAARVEELTTLQRIDEELNATLDPEVVLTLTLSWALRATEAESGTLSILDDGRLVRTVSRAGSEDVAEPEPETVRLAMISEEPVVIDSVQLLVPIHYESQVVGFLDLRGKGGCRFQPERVQFAGRLVDHAAVAIENARLYEQAQREIGERKRAEDQLQRYAAELERANEEVKRFAYIVSHDLRSPLLNMRGFAAELRLALDEIQAVMETATPHLDERQRQAVQYALHEDAPEALAFIDSSVEHMDSFISALLKLSRLGRRELKLERVDMNGIVASIVPTLAHQIAAHEGEVRVGELPEAMADRTSMEQVMANILGNAVKYLTSERPAEIEVSGERLEKEMIFHVRDNGRGIAERDMDKVFTPFRRAGRQDVPGEGMGLAYVQALVRRHGGRAWYESEFGVGATFSFTISNELEGGEGVDYG